jgi:uncharacterized lipoprotein YajG
MKKMKWFMSFAVVLFAVFLIAGCSGEDTELLSNEDTYVTLDINPSVELIVSPSDIVIYANPLNEDGELLLLDLELVGLPVDEAVDLIIAEAIALGFIDTEDEEIVVAVDVQAKKAEIREAVQNRIKEHVNASFNARAMIGRAVDKGYMPDFIAEAESYGVNPGFLRLAQKVVEMSDELTLEDVIGMEQEELMDLLQEKKQEHREVAESIKDDFLNERDALIASYQEQIEALELQIEEALEGENIDELLAQLETLKEELKDELDELRDEYHDMSEVLFMEMMQQRNRIKEEHQERVEEYLDRAEERRQAIQDRIDRFQNRDDEDDEDGEDNPGNRP